MPLKQRSRRGRSKQSWRHGGYISCSRRGRSKQPGRHGGYSSCSRRGRGKQPGRRRRIFGGEKGSWQPSRPELRRQFESARGNNFESWSGHSNYESSGNGSERSRRGNSEQPGKHGCGRRRRRRSAGAVKSPRAHIM